MLKNSVGCVVVTYNIGKDFYKCFNSIYEQVDYVVIVDNGSNVETTRVLEELDNKENVKVVYNNENLGIATALNIGIKEILNMGYKWILTMDNDSEATIGMVDNMLQTYNIASKCDNKIVSIFPSYEEKGFYDANLNKKSNKDEYQYSYIEAEITSGNLLKAEVFSEIGFLKDEYFIDYVDHEYCLRLLKNGYKLIRAENSVLLHSLGNSKKVSIFGKSLTYTNHNALRRYYITRNRHDVWKLYEDFNNKFIKHDKRAYKKELLKIILFEEDKLKKLKSVIEGKQHFKKRIFSKKNQI